MSDGLLPASQHGQVVNRSACRSCGAAILWVVTATGKRTPVNDDGTDVSHFSTCPDSGNWRKKGGKSS